MGYPLLLHIFTHIVDFVGKEQNDDPPASASERSGVAPAREDAEASQCRSPSLEMRTSVGRVGYADQSEQRGFPTPHRDDKQYNGNLKPSFADEQSRRVEQGKRAAARISVTENRVFDD